MRRGRELPALLLALVWIFGVVVAPALHLALHGSLSSHTHGAHASSRVDAATASSTDDCHEGHCHADPATIEADGSDDAPADHGRGSLAHGDVAALFPAPALLIPPFVAIAERALPAAQDHVADAPSRVTHPARGPPTTA